MSFWHRIGSWKISEWIYVHGRDLFLCLRFAKHSGRQHFHIGWLNKRFDKKDLKNFLKKQGFEHDTYAWVDDKEVLNMRKIVKEKYQYHIRLHKDNEIRGHYEYAPDAKPLKHLHSRFVRMKKRQFRKLLKEYLGSH